MATHSSILAWKISWTEDPGELQFLELQRVGHNLQTEDQSYFFPSSMFTDTMQYYVRLN